MQFFGLVVCWLYLFCMFCNQQTIFGFVKKQIYFETAADLGAAISGLQNGVRPKFARSKNAPGFSPDVLYTFRFRKVYA